MNTQEIRAALKARLDALKERYDVRKGIQLSVDVDEFLAVSAECRDDELQFLRHKVAKRRPIHVLLWPRQLERLLDAPAIVPQSAPVPAEDVPSE
jgi:hypothetical protein